MIIKGNKSKKNRRLMTVAMMNSLVP